MKRETFTEIYSAETGYNLMHFAVEPDLGHITGEACPCGPERVEQLPDIEPHDGPRKTVVIDAESGESWIEDVRHDRDDLTELDVANFRQEIAEAELAAILAGCPHWEPCATEADCYRRGPDCRCVEPHETEPECRAWLREHSDGTE